MNTSVKISLIIFLYLFLSSCSPTVVYQVLEIASNDVKLVNNSFVHQNTDLSIHYNLWENGGKVHFMVTNDKDQPVYIDWNESHFIYGGISYEYWDDSEETTFYSQTNMFTSTSLLGEAFSIFSAGSAANSVSQSVTSRRRSASVTSKNVNKPKRILHLPPKSSIVVSKFKISNTPYYTCEFPVKASTVKKPMEAKFKDETSPLKFTNYLTYSYDENFKSKKVINNEFYISSIENMNYNRFTGKSVKEKKCNKYGGEYKVSNFEYPFLSPGAFYIVVY